MPTEVAATVPEVSVPKTATISPTLTLAKVGDVTSWSRYVVAPVTSTVIVDPPWVVTVNVSVPTEATVPIADGCPDPAAGRSPACWG